LVAHETRRFFYGYVIVTAAFIILAMTEGALYTYGVFLKPLAAEFGWSRAAISGAYSLSMVLFGPCCIVTGRLNDKYGPRIVVTACGLIMGLGYLLMSQVHAIWQLYLFHVLAASVGVSIFVPLTSTVARWFVKRRGLMTGFVVAGVGVGTVVMPPIANWLISNFGWRISYAFMGIMALVVITSASQFLRRDPISVGLLPYGDSDVTEAGLNSTRQGLSLWRAIHTGQFWILLVMLLLFNIYLHGVMVHIVPHAIELGISAAIGATVLSTIGGVGIVGRIVMGGVSDRIGSRLAITFCFLIPVLALFWLLAAKQVWMLYLFAVIFGFAYGGFVALQSPIVAELFSLGSHGVILGSIIVGGGIGAAIGPVVLGRIFDLTGSYNQGFLLCASIAVPGFILSLFLRSAVTKSPREKIEPH